MKRIYKEYGIRVTDESGSRMVRINKNVDMTNFSIARETYNKTKDRYINKNEDITIELVGITLEGEIGNVIYSKTFVREVANEDKELLLETDEIVDNIKHSLELLIRKREYHTNMVCALNKKQDVILHNIENIGDMDDSIKLNTIKELEEVRKYRRFNKTEEKKLKTLDIVVDLGKVDELFRRVTLPIDTEGFRYLNEKELDDMKIIKEIRYNSEKDRIHKMEQIRKKYDKIVVDDAKNTIICYNRGYTNTNKN